MLSSEAHPHAATDLLTTRHDHWEFRHAAITDVGRQRDHNEDFYLLSPERNLVVVADGMGGHAAGEVASRLAAETVTAYFDELDLSGPSLPSHGEDRLSTHLTKAIDIANSTIQDHAAEHREQSGMGTTIVALAFSGDQAVWAHVGDSRLYRFRDDILTPMTRDHSLLEQTVAEQNLSKPEATRVRKHFPYKNILTRALGTRSALEVDIDNAALRDGDVFLISTDGLHDTLDDSAIAEILQHHSPDWPTACHAFVEAANRAGGPDNITAACVQIRRI